jgi:O-antigen ligase
MNNKSILNIDISNFNSYLVIFLGFWLPISVSIATIILAIIFLLWLYEGNFIYKYNIMRNNPITYAFFAFFVVHVIGLIWTDNIEWGIHIIIKEWRMLLPLILITIVKKNHIKYYFLSFLIAISISEILSYSIWSEIISPFKSATIYNPTPFMSHISYNPFLAFSIYLLGYFLLLEKNNTYTNKLFSILFVISMSINMFITGGRAGQVGFFLMLCLITIQYFKKSIIKQFIVIGIFIPIIFFAFYNMSSIFQTRVDLAIKNSQTFQENPNTSVGFRLTFLFNSIEVIKENLLFGVGTGDYLDAYNKVHKKNTPNVLNNHVNPHNMYLLVLMQTGLLGLMALLSIFYVQIRQSFKKNEFYQIQMALPVLFLVIMLSDSYLLGHYTSLLFVYFSSFLYKDFDNEYI